LVLIADGYEDSQTDISHQRVDQAAMLRPVLKGESLLKGDPAETVEDLLAKATAHPPGPVYLEVAGSRIRKPASKVAAPSAKGVAKADAAALEKARAMLAKAKRPLLLVGLQARTDRPAKVLRDFIAKTGVPVLTTYKAKGVASDLDPKTLGHYMGGVSEDPAIREADLLLMYGFDPVEGPPNKWRYGDQQSLELTEHVYDFPLFTATHQVVGDIANSLEQIAGALGPVSWTESELAAHKKRISTAARVPMGKGVSPQQVVDAAAAAMPADCRITIDAGAHMLPVLHLWKSAEPRQSLISRGLSTMGFALPAAVASCLVDPGRRTIAFTGDGGLMMCLGEMGTAFQEGIAPIVVVFNDSSLTLIGVKQRRRQLASAGVDFCDADFAQMARGFGWEAWRVTDSADLAKAFADAIASNKPALIDVVINPEEYEAQILAVRG
jgi:acetolactate synthase-1/2/3 large subunit